MFVFVSCHRSLCWVGHLRIFITSYVINTNAICGKTSPSSLRGGILPPWTSSVIRHRQWYNYGVLGRHNDISVTQDMQNAIEAYLVYPYSCQWPEKWRFVCWWIIIVIGIYETHQASSQEELHLKVTLGCITSDCGHSETRLSDKLSPLTKPFKSSSL